MCKTLELNCKWNFAEQTGGTDTGANNPMLQNFNEENYASLVRESIQNSLDAINDKTKPVRMEFVISDITRNNFPNLFDISKRFDGILDYYKDSPDIKERFQPTIDFFNSMNRLPENLQKLSYLRISDYNTKGMPYIANNTTNPFYAFVRAVGIDVKYDNKGAGGSFGLGKGAYYQSSPLRTLLVSTRDTNDNTFFEGVAFLATHNAINENGEKRKSFNVIFYDNNDGKPMTDNIPERFRRKAEYGPGTDFLLLGINASYVKPQIRDERGRLVDDTDYSIITDSQIITKNEQDIYKQIAESVLTNYWMSVEKGCLEVIVGNNKNPLYTINKDNLKELMEQFFPTLKDKKTEPHSNPRPYWEAVHYAGTDADKYIIIEDSKELLGKARLYINKNEYGNGGIAYMRSPKMFVFAKNAATVEHFFGVFYCDDAVGNENLRSTENASHTEWKSKNCKVNGKTKNKAIEVLSELREFVDSAIKKAYPNNYTDVQDVPGLEEYLSIPTDEDDDNETGTPSAKGARKESSEEDGTHLTIVRKDKVKPLTTKTSEAKLRIKNSKTTRLIKTDDDEGIPGGLSSTPIHTPNHGHMGDENIKDKFKKGNDGRRAHDTTIISTNFRSYAKSEDGNVLHNLIIKSDKNYEKVNILVTTATSTSIGKDGIINIKKCIYHYTDEYGVKHNTECQVFNNQICNAGLHIGKNEFTIQFADNMKHALILTVDE